MTAEDFDKEKYRAGVIEYIYSITRLDKLKVVYTFSKNFSEYENNIR